MLLTNLAILTSVYLGKQLLHICKKDRPGSKYLSTDQDTNKTVPSELQVHQYYVSTSGVSILLFTAGRFLYPPLTLVNIGLISYTSVPILQRTLTSLRTQKKINNDGYSALITVLTLGTGNYLAATMHNLLYHVSSYLVEKSKENTTSLTAQIYHPVPDKVWIVDNSVETQISLEQL